MKKISMIMSYVLAFLFSILALFYVKDEQHIEWCLVWACALLAFLNAGIREIK